MPSYAQLSYRHEDDEGIFVDVGGLSRAARLSSTLSAIIVTSPRNVVSCRICEAGILKGEQCFAWMARTPASYVSSPGRYRSTGVRWFVHFDCLIGAITDLAAGRPSGCSLCGADVELSMVRRRHSVIRVCGECLRLFPKVCISCSLPVSLSESSLALGPIPHIDPFDSDHLIEEPLAGVVCDGCSRNYDIETVNSRRVRLAAERREREFQRQAAADVVDWLSDA